MSWRRVSDLLKRAEWYAAMYGLAAHRSHAALEMEPGDRRDHELQRARKEALLLALGCAARIANVRPPELEMLDRELFPDPQKDVKGARRSPRAPTPRLPKRYAVRRNAGMIDTAALLREFVAETVEPSAFVLLAGIVAAIKPPRTGTPAKPWALEERVTKLSTAVATDDGPDPERLVATALKLPMDARAHYNVACYYAQTAVGNENRLALARSYLEAAVRNTHGGAHVAMAAWAWKDPALGPALPGWSRAQEVLGPRPTPAAAPETPELERTAEERLRTEVAAYKDDELARTALDEFWKGIGTDQDVDPKVRLAIHDDLRGAEKQLEGRVALSHEARGHLRSFLLNTRLQRVRN